MKKKDIGYGIAGFGSALLAYYVYTKTKGKPATTTQNSTSTQNSTPNQTGTPSPNNTQSTTPSQCQKITPDNYSQQLLAQCFGGSITQCGLYEPLISTNGFCEALSPSTNYAVTQPDIKSGLVFYNSTNGFFGIYWDYPGTFGGVSPCYCSGNKIALPYDQTGAFFSFIGLILPNGYTWLPVYYFPSSGIGFLTYEGALWYSPGLTYGLLGYLKNNNQVYTIKLPGTPDSIGFTIQTYSTPADTGGALCFNYPDLNSSFCVDIAPNQSIPFWANDATTVKWCPANNQPNCQTVY